MRSWYWLPDSSGLRIRLLLPQFSPRSSAGGRCQARREPATTLPSPIRSTPRFKNGFNNFESATYSRDDGRKLTLRAARFADASGAYGAYTYYKTPEMLIEKVGDGAASMNERVLFYRGNILVDAVFQKLSAMSAAELRELAQDLPLPAGNTRPQFAGIARLSATAILRKEHGEVCGGVGRPTKPGCSSSSLAGGLQLRSRGGAGELQHPGWRSHADVDLLSDAANPAEHLRRIEAASPQNNGAAASSTPMLVNPIFDKRTGPIVVVVAGPLSQAEASPCSRR